MNWPTSQDYNEAIQNPRSSLADPDLQGGEAVVNPLGLPVPRSGNFADVYKFRSADGSFVALKCFTRKVSGLQQRYAKISQHLAKANFPFTVGFDYQEQGVRVRGHWFPLLKMEWVEGFTLNEFVRDNATKPQYLHALTQMWAKLCGRLRDGNFAHADLQHGNVLLVPATSGTKLQLRLIDYDGMWVPALADTHSGEVGHPNFQHPLRLKDRLYTGDVDRFPHLVIASALRATLVGGRNLWDRFDNGDNLLFKEADLRDPAASRVFKELWGLGDDALCALVGKLALAAGDPLRKTPWLDDVLLATGSPRLTGEEEEAVVKLLGVAPHFAAGRDTHAPVVEAYNHFDFFDESEADEPEPEPNNPAKSPPAKAPRRREKPSKSSRTPILVGAAVAVLALVGVVVALTGGKKEPQAVAQNDSKKEERPTTTSKREPSLTATSKKELSSTTAKERKDPPVEPKKVPIPPPDPVKEPPVEPKKLPAATPAGELAEAWAVPVATGRHGLTFTQDSGKLVVAAGKQPEVRLYDVKSGGLSDSFPTGDAPIEALFVVPMGRLLVNDATNKPAVWDMKTKQVAVPVEVSPGLPQAIGIVNSYNDAWMADREGRIAIVKLANGKFSSSHPIKVDAPVTAISCGVAGRPSLALTKDGQIFVRMMAGFRPLSEVKGCLGVLVAPDGQHFVATGTDGLLRVYETESGQTYRDLAGHTGTVTAAAFSKNGKYVLSVGEDKSFRVWDVEAGKQVQRIDLGGKGAAVMVSPTGKHAATSQAEPPSTRLWLLPEELTQ